MKIKVTIKPIDQKEVDAQAIREGKAKSNDTPDTVSAFAKRGIRVHDRDQDTWGLKHLPRYERD